MEIFLQVFCNDLCSDVLALCRKSGYGPANLLFQLSDKIVSRVRVDFSLLSISSSSECCEVKYAERPSQRKLTYGYFIANSGANFRHCSVNTKGSVKGRNVLNVHS